MGTLIGQILQTVSTKDGQASCAVESTNIKEGLDRLEKSGDQPGGSLKAPLTSFNNPKWDQYIEPSNKLDEVQTTKDLDRLEGTSGDRSVERKDDDMNENHDTSPEKVDLPLIKPIGDSTPALNTSDASKVEDMLLKGSNHKSDKSASKGSQKLTPNHDIRHNIAIEPEKDVDPKEERIMEETENPQMIDETNKFQDVEYAGGSECLESKEYRTRRFFKMDKSWGLTGKTRDPPDWRDFDPVERLICSRKNEGKMSKRDIRTLVQFGCKYEDPLILNVRDYETTVNEFCQNNLSIQMPPLPSSLIPMTKEWREQRKLEKERSVAVMAAHAMTNNDNNDCDRYRSRSHTADNHNDTVSTQFL